MTTITQTPQWSLVALSPQLGDLSVPLGISTSVGRHQDNDIVLATQQVSRHHAKFNQIGSNLFVQDLGSSNGTFVNGSRIATEAVALQPDDEVGFADILFVISQETVASEIKHDSPIMTSQSFPESPVMVTEPAVATNIATEVVPLPATVITETTSTSTLATPTSEVTTNPAASVTQIENTRANPDLLEVVTTPRQAAVEPTVAPSPNPKPTLAPTPLSNLVNQNPTPSTPQTLSAITPSAPSPKSGSTQAWLVAVFIVILIVAAIVATLFLK